MPIIVLYLHLVVTNSCLPLLPNDIGHNIFAVRLLTIFEHIVLALMHRVRPFLTFVLVFVTNKDANAETS